MSDELLRDIRFYCGATAVVAFWILSQGCAARPVRDTEIRDELRAIHETLKTLQVKEAPKTQP